MRHYTCIELSSVLSLLVFCSGAIGLGGCTPPHLVSPSPPERVVVLENGQIKQLNLITIFGSSIPILIVQGGPADYVSETIPGPGAASLRTFTDHCPEWRRTSYVIPEFVCPMQHTTVDDRYEWRTYHRHVFVLSLKPVIVGVAAEPMPELPPRPANELVRVQDLDSDVRIVRLIWAQRFPPSKEIRKVTTKVQARTHLAEAVERAGFELIEPRLIELDYPMTIGEAMKFIEANEEFHTVKP